MCNLPRRAHRPTAVRRQTATAGRVVWRRAASHHRPQQRRRPSGAWPATGGRTPRSCGHRTRPRRRRCPRAASPWAAGVHQRRWRRRRRQRWRRRRRQSDVARPLLFLLLHGRRWGRLMRLARRRRALRLRLIGSHRLLIGEQRRVLRRLRLVGVRDRIVEEGTCPLLLLLAPPLLVVRFLFLPRLLLAPSSSSAFPPSCCRRCRRVLLLRPIVAVVVGSGGAVGRLRGGQSNSEMHTASDPRAGSPCPRARRARLVSRASRPMAAPRHRPRNGHSRVRVRQSPRVARLAAGRRADRPRVGRRIAHTRQARAPARMDSPSAPPRLVPSPPLHRATAAAVGRAARDPTPRHARRPAVPLHPRGIAPTSPHIISTAQGQRDSPRGAVGGPRGATARPGHADRLHRRTVAPADQEEERVALERASELTPRGQRMAYLLPPAQAPSPRCAGPAQPIIASSVHAAPR